MSRLLQWLCCAWVLGVTGRYAVTLWRTLHQPFNPGEDSTWFTAWLVACGFLVITSLVLPSRWARRLIFGFGAIGGATVLTLSHSWPMAIAAAWLLLVCAGTGMLVLRGFRVQARGLAEVLTLSIPSGMAALALLFLALGLSGNFQDGVLVGVLAGLTLALVILAVGRPTSLLSAGAEFDTAKDDFGVSKAGTRVSNLLQGLIVFSALLNLTWAIAPEVQFDALNYHLSVPDAYLRAGAIVDLPFMHAYLSRLVELVSAVALAAGGPIAVKLFVFGLSLGAAAATYALGAVLFDRTIGMWAAAIFYTAPAVGWLTGTVYIDNVTALFSAAGLLAFVRWTKDANSGWFCVTALIGGLAVGSKLNEWFAFVVILPVMAIGTWRSRRTLAAGCVLFVTVAAPYYLLAWKFTGNPVFPLLNGFFQSPLWPTDAGVFNAVYFGLPASFSNLLVFPFRLTLDTSRFAEAMPRGALGLSLMLVFPFVFAVLPRIGGTARLVFAATAVYLLALFFSMQYVRYAVVALPGLAVFAAATTLEWGANGNLLRRRIVELCLLVGLIVQFPALSVQYWNIPERFPLGVALGWESREDFAARALGGYAAVAHLRQTAREGDRVLGVETENLRFYAGLPLDTPPLSLLGSPARRVAEMPAGQDLATAIRGAGYTVLLARNKQLEEIPPGYGFLDPAFLKTYATLEFRDSEVSLFRFR